MPGHIIDALSIAALALGLLLATIGLIGLLRMDEIPKQLHAAGLITGPATVLIMVASIGTGSWAIVTSALLVGLFVLITSPLSAHAIAQADRLREGPDED